MATFTRSETTSTVVEFRVPAPPGIGAPWAEVDKAVRVALNELSAHPVRDNTVTVRPGDDEIVVSYVKPT